MDFAGTVETIGPGVTSYKVGDRVFGMSPETFGAHAENVCVGADCQIAKMPADLPFGEAVVCEGAWYAETNLRWLRLEAGQNILIYGASGAIGVAAVQLAKARGATVTAVVGTSHMELATSLGADLVIDYTTEDFTEVDDTIDAVFDAVGKTTYGQCRRLMKPTARFAATDLGPWWQNIWLSIWHRLARSRRVNIPFPVSRQDFVDEIGKLMDDGAYRAVIDRTYLLEAIADAYHYVGKGQKTGIVVIDLGSN